MLRGHTSALRSAAAAVVVCGGLIVASCSGGSVSGTPPGALNAAPSLQSIPTSGGTLTVPAAGNGQVASFGIGSGVTAGNFLTSSSSTMAPGSAPAVSAVARRIESLAGAVPFFYVTFSVSAGISSAYFTTDTVTLTSAQPANGIYYAEFDDISATPGTKLGVSGPGVVSNGSVTITNGGGPNTPILVPGHTYLLQFFYLPAGSTSTP